MKCVCGYYHLEDWQIKMEDVVFQDDLRKNNGSEKFLHIKGSFHLEGEYGRDREVSVYTCPKCGTLKIN